MTTSPDVTVSTNLGPWVNRRGIFNRTEPADTFREEHVVSAQRWAMSPQGQHIELGIAESNLFLQLAVLGLAGPVFGTRLLPIGTLYDPFIKRGHDALNYACYQVILVATPSGITLAPEGGAHQSVGEPLTGLAQPGLASFEPAYADELATLLRWAFEEIQRDAGESVYFRLSTRPIEQPQRTIGPDLAEAIVAGGYWLRESASNAELAIAYCGAVAPEALAAHQAVAEEIAGAGLLAITSPDRLHRDWQAARVGGAVSPNDCWRGCGRVQRSSPSATFTRLPCHGSAPSLATRSCRSASTALANPGDIPDLYRAYGIDSDAILDAAARACLTTLRQTG